jgi:hypothetical protein
MLKIILLSLGILTSSCAMFGSANKSDENQSPEEKFEQIKKEHDLMRVEHKKAQESLKWLSGVINAHDKEIIEHEKIVARTEVLLTEIAKSNQTSMANKKKLLELQRLQDDMQKEHDHLAESHDEMMVIIGQIEDLREELNSHEGHQH